MSYQKQHFVPEQYLSAAELNHLEDGIELNRTLVRNFEAAHIEALFKNSEVEPDRIVDNDTSGWSDTQSAPAANEHTYLTLRIASNKAWSKPIKISSVGHLSGGGSGDDEGTGSGPSSSDIDAELQKQLEEIYKRLEEAEKTAQDASDLANSLSDQANEKKEQLEQLAQEMTPLAEWTDGTNTGTAGFVAKADQNSAQLAGIATWQGTTSDSIAALELKATETEASITSLASWQDEKTETIASIQQTASDQAATISMLTEWKGTVENGEAGDTSTAIAAINVKVDGLESEIDLLNTYVTEDAAALADFKTIAGNTYATIEGLTKVETDAVNSLAEFRNEVTDTYATHEELTSFETDTTQAINRIKQKADANESSIKSLTSWQGTVDKSITSIAGIEQKANANEAAIDLVVDNGTVKGNVLVEAINNQSTVSISGDKINLNGNATFTSAIAAANNAANSAATKANNAVKSVQYSYLSTSSPTITPSVNDSGWKATADEWQSGKYLWQKITVTKGDDTVTNSISCLSGAKGAAGAPGVNLEVRYINSATTPVISGNNVTGWSTTIPAPEVDKVTYMTQKLSSEANWSIPVQITGQNGKDGTAAPKVKEVKTQYTFTSSDKTAPGASATWGYDDVPTNWTSSAPVCVWTRDEFTFDDGSAIYSEAVFNQSYSNIANWCDATDRTLINGANIATGSITAQQIAAGSITANEIDATNLKVKAANIEGTLTASQINGEGLKISSADSSSTTAVTIDGGKIKIAKTKNSVAKGYLSFDGTNVQLYGDGVPLYLQSSTQIHLSTPYNLGLDTSYGNITQEAGGKIIFVPAQSTASTTSSHKLNLEWDSANSRLVVNPENKLLLSSDNNVAVQAPNIYLSAASTGVGQLTGTWKLGSGTLTTSAREAKNSIEDVDNRYSVLLDNLKPRRFKYNDGTSNRYHTGLIVDEVKDAMDIAEIDSSEFAAYCLDEEGGGIRYSELITLLIKEVQDLKKQVAELKSPTE